MAIPTPYSYRQYTGDGSAKDFSIPFPYLQRVHVHVYLDNKELTVGTDYTWTSGTQIQLTVAPTSKLTIRRITPEDAQIVQWKDGSYIIQDDLNESDKQWLYLIQEHHDQLMLLQYGSSTLPGGGSPAVSLAFWNRLARNADPEKGKATETAQTVDATDQKKGDWVADDKHVATTGALSERFDVIMSDTTPPPPPPGEGRQGGKLWVDTAGLAISYWEPAAKAWVNIAGSGPQGPAGGGVASVTGTAPIQVAASTTTPLVSITPATASAAGSMSAVDKAKLDGLSNYTLPIASAATLGGVKVGANLSVDPTTGVLSGQLPGALVYKGLRDVSQPAPAMPAVGWVYVSSATKSADASWVGLNGVIHAGDMVLFDGTNWGKVGASGSTATGVQVVTGTAPVRIGGTATGPDVSVDHVTASVSGAGGNAGLMTAADKEKLDKLDPNAADGTVTSVSGAGAVKVTNPTTTPVVSVDDATTAVQGVVRLADAAAVTAGTAGRVVDAAQLKTALASISSGATVHVGPTPPSNPKAGDLWYSNNDGRLYVWYVDGSSSQWVDASPDSPELWTKTGSNIHFDTGKVGINTASPRTRLDINGAVSSPEQTITAGAFDLSTGNFWTCGAIAIPNPTNQVAGTSGLIRVTAAPTSFASNFKFPGGSYTAPATFPAIIPFYVQASGTILMGKWTEGIA